METGNVKYDLLAEFDFVVDLDLAMYKFIRYNYGESPMVDQEFMHLHDEREVIYRLLNRPHLNPLEIMIPDAEVTQMYYDIMDNHYEELLSYATAYDTFKLFVTYLTSVSAPICITILCKNKLEQDFIKKLNPKIGTMISSKEMVLMSRYTSIYVKYLASLFQYQRIAGKNIYFAAAKFNMEEDKDLIKGRYVYPFSDINSIHMIDLYTKVKYRFKKG